MQSTVRHLVGAGIGVVAFAALLAISWWCAREWHLFAAMMKPGHGLVFIFAILLLGVVAGVLCGGRVVSPLASLVSGALLLVLNLVFWLPLALGMKGPVGMGGFLYEVVGFTPISFALAFVLLTASAFPSRWAGERTRPAPRPLPAQEVQRS